MIDQPGSIAQLALAVAARRGTPVAYVPGLVMRRAADLYPGEAKTDRRDAYVLADTGRTRRKQVHWLDASSDELLATLRVLNGFDIDLAADATRLANRLRDALTSVSPALERAVGERLGQAGVRDLLTKYPTLTALRAASQSRIERTIQARSPRIAAKVTTAIAAALAAQDVTVPAEAATGRVIAELAGELDRVCARRDALAAEIEEAFLSTLSVSCWPPCQGSGRGRPPDPRRDRRRLRLHQRQQARRLRRPGPRLPPVRHVPGRRNPQPARQPPAQKRHVPRRVRLPARPGVQDLLRPQTRRGQTPQRRPHLPGPPPLRRHPRHAPHRPALPASPPCHQPGQRRLTRTKPTAQRA